MPNPFTRRRFLGSMASVLATPGAAAPALLTRPIPSSGEAIPLVGLGSWITFNVGNDREARDSCADVMRAFFAAGGRMIDSSPMYGSSQPVIGYGLQKFGAPNLFSAEKVWTSSPARGPAQIEASRKFWAVPKKEILSVLKASPPPVPIVGPAGTAVVFHCNLLHASGHNLSAEDRWHIYISFNACANAPKLTAESRGDWVVSRNTAPLPIEDDGGILKAA